MVSLCGWVLITLWDMAAAQPPARTLCPYSHLCPFKLPLPARGMAPLGMIPYLRKGDQRCPDGRAGGGGYLHHVCTHCLTRVP